MLVCGFSGYSSFLPLDSHDFLVASFYLEEKITELPHALPIHT